MKKRFLLPLILIAAVVLSLCACGESGKTAKLDKTELTLCVGGRETLTLYWAEDEGEPVPLSAEEGAEYRWESSDESVVTVTGNGGSATVSAVKEGKAVVTVYQGSDALTSCNVTVVTSPLSVTVPEGKLVLRKDATATVRAKSIEPLTEEYVWESSDPSIATVEYQGEIARVTAMKRGECTITVRSGVYTASFTLIVGLT